MSTTQQFNLSLRQLIGSGYTDFWRDHHFYRVVKGSRGSKKSVTTAHNLIYRLVKYHWSNILVVRRNANTNKTSTFVECKKAINDFHLERYFKYNESLPEITYLPTGQKIIFRGLDDPLKLTSVNVLTGELCWLWVEEAYEIESFSKLQTVIESLRGNDPQVFYQVTITFNPWNEHHWLKREFFDQPRDDAFVRTTTVRCNEFVSDEYKQRLYSLYQTNPRRAKTVVDGDWGVAEGLVFEDNVEQVDFNAMDKIQECGQTGFGLDYGFGNDPNAFVAVAVDVRNKQLWVYDEMYTYHQTTPHIAEWLKANGYERARIYADSANPERTAQLNDLGITNADSVVKTPVEAGIDQLWQYKIHVHPKCKNLWRELNSYVFDSDRMGNTLSKPKDQDNHAIDALRYAVRQYMGDYDGSLGVKWDEQYAIGRQMGVSDY